MRPPNSWGESITSPDGHEFAIKVIKKLRETVDNWKKETGIGFVLHSTVSRALCYRFARIDRELYGAIKDITDKEHYTCSYHVGNNEELEVYQLLKTEAEFQQISSGGAMACVKLPDYKEENEFEELIKYIYENIPYLEFNWI